MTRSNTPDYQTLRQQFEDQNQGHVFRFWDSLDAAGRERLLRQLAAIDLAPLLESLDRHASARSASPPKLEPADVERLPGRGGDLARAQEARARGEALLAAGRVAVLVVAGGQGSRLGFDGPKGAFPLGPVSDRCLFELQAQKLRGLARRIGRPLPWYVMTSEATDAATRELFARSAHFGLSPEDVMFFRQGMAPSFDFEGRILLAAPDAIFESPNGHGGALTALLASGALDDMERRGADLLFYYQVDNPLVRIGDPVYLGFHAMTGAEMSCKVVRKSDPIERVGVVARVDGRPGVIEYTEISDEHRLERDAAGDLVYWAGNIAVHVFDTSFVRRVAGAADRLLPFHVSAKKVPALDTRGRLLTPDAPNGNKLERFVFDALPAARAVCIVEADRRDEYSPVKNADGEDSPATARRDLSAQVRGWLAAAGAPLPDEGIPVEVNHAQVDSAEDARALGAAALGPAGDAVCHGTDATL